MRAARLIGPQGRILVLLQCGRDTEQDQCNHRGDIGVENLGRAHAVDPHHRGRGVAHHAARTASIGGGDDRGEVPDVDLAAKDGVRHGTPDQCRGDVVEKR